MPSRTSSGASSIWGRPGTRASPMPAMTRRIDGAVLSRRARMATTTSTTRSSNSVWIVAVMPHIMFDIIDRSNIAPLMIEPMVGVPDGSIISSKTPSSFKFIMRLQSEVLAGGASEPPSWTANGLWPLIWAITQTPSPTKGQPHAEPSCRRSIDKR
jgi:hypothetical protein